MVAQDSHDRVLHLVEGTVRHLLDQLASEIGGHDQNGVAEVDRTALAVSQPAVVEDLQEDVEHV